MSKFVHGVIIETTNCTVMCCSRRKREARWKYKGKTRGEKSEKHMAHVKKKMIEIIFPWCILKNFGCAVMQTSKCEQFDV